MRNLVTAALVAALPLASANAEIITVEYEAMLPGSAFGLAEDVHMVGTFSFDSEVPPQVVVIDQLVSYALLTHSMTLNGTLFSGSTNQLMIANDLLIQFFYSDQYFATSSTTGDFNGLDITAFGLKLIRFDLEPGGGPLTSLALPLTREELDGFESYQAGVSVSGASVPIRGGLTRLEVLSDSAPLAVECEGFAPPFDVDIGLAKREQRVIPLRMEIFEGDLPLGPNDITAPTVSVSYAVGGSGEDLSPLVDSPGNATPGNSFRWDAATERWAFNLSTRPYAAAGTYTVTAVAGDADYVLSPPCSNTFVRQ